MKRLTRLILPALLLIASPSHALLLTGADLLADPTVSFPDRSATASGTSVALGTSSVHNAFMMSRDLLSAGSISTGDAGVEYSFTYSMTRQTNDLDPAIGIYDGTRYVGFRILDNPLADIMSSTVGNSGGKLFYNEGIVNGDRNPEGGFSFPAIGNELLITVDILMENGSTTITAKDGFTNNVIKAATVTGALAIDRTQELDLVLAGQNTGESYLLNSIEINGGAASAVSTSGTLALALLGLGGFRLRQHLNA